MSALFYLSAVVAVIATLMAVTRSNAVHALLYFVVSLLAVALIFYTLGAPFAAALEVIIYAGAIIVLFIFVVMMLNLGKSSTAQERRWIHPGIWVGPTVLSAVLAAELCYMLAAAGGPMPEPQTVINAKRVGIALFGPYLLAVELASLLLLAGLVVAYHLARGEERS